jgi:hypothetical protein
MKLRLFLLLVPVILKAQDNLVFEAYKIWDQQHPRSDYKARYQSLLEASAEWVAKWPDSQLAWMQRRDAVLNSKNPTAELWKQVDEKLISLHPPHTFATVAAYDWVTAKVNVKEAETLLAAEIAWQDSKSHPTLVSPTLDLLIDEANEAASSFDPLCTMALAQIQLKEFDAARATIGRIHNWLTGDFTRYFDQDPLETVPNDQSKYYTLSAQLAEAEGRHLDALAFYHSVITNPWFRRAYNGYVKTTQAIWTEAGGTKEGWAEFSRVEPLPAGVPAGNLGTSFLPWVSLHYKLPDGTNIQRKDFEGRPRSSTCGLPGARPAGIIYPISRPFMTASRTGPTSASSP